MPAYPYYGQYNYQYPWAIPYNGYNISSNPYSMQPAAMPQTTPQTVAPVQTPSVMQDGFKWINSEKEALEYFVEPNHAVALWNANEPVVYLKQADTTGKPTIKTYDLVERVTAESTEMKPSDYVTKEDMSALVGVIKNMQTDIQSMKDVGSAIGAIKNDIDTIKGDMYGIAGKKKAVRKTEADVDE